MDPLLYLMPNVQVEPLFAHWYVWPHLIPPATAARNLTERYIPIMDSYISAPMIHAMAVKNPKMLGGPFIDHGGQRVDEIRQCRQSAQTELADLFGLSAAIAELDNFLRLNAKGFSLESCYAAVPEILKGFVELGYDLNNHASFRLLEPLLYRSSLYVKRAQSLMLSRTTGDDRPFVLSTPRLEDERSVHFRIAFDDERVDQLFRMKRTPRHWSEILHLFEPHRAQEKLIRSWFTEQPPRPYVPYLGRGVRWRYFGHACILLESSGVNLLLDPVLSYTYESNISRYTYEDLPDTIDYVLITHNHTDHILFETLLQLRHRIRNIVVPRNGGGALHDPSVRSALQAVGFPNVIDLGEMDSIEFANGRITGVPFLGEHGDLHIRTKLMYAVQLGRHRLLFAADCCNLEPRLYQHVHCDIGDMDALFLGMECDGAPLSWLYGPLQTQKTPRAQDESRRLAGSNCRQGLDFVQRFGCRELYVYAMGQEPWLNYVMSIKYTEQSRPIVESNKLIEECRARGLGVERLFGEKEILLDS